MADLGPCDLWPGAVNGNGYGHRKVGPGVVRYVHVLAWEAVNGPVPEGFELDHMCGVRRCRRVSHLEVVTHAENVRRGRAAKLSAEDRAAILTSAESCRALAPRFGVHPTTIGRLRRGVTWAEAA